MIFKKLLPRRSKSFIVRLGRKGQVKLLGKVEARDHNELLEKIMTEIQKLGEEAKQYTRISIIDVESGQELRIKNPFSQEEELGAERSGRSRDSLDPETLRKVVSNAVSVYTVVYNTVFQEFVKAFTSLYVDSMKSLSTVKPQAPQEQQYDLNQLINLVSSIRWLIENKEKVEEVLKSR